MSDYVVELAKQIQKSKPNATMPILVWLKDYSKENVDLLSAKGLKIRKVMRRLKLVTGEVKADPKIAEEIKTLAIVRRLSASSELEVLG